MVQKRRNKIIIDTQRYFYKAVQPQLAKEKYSKTMINLINEEIENLQAEISEIQSEVKRYENLKNELSEL